MSPSYHVPDLTEFDIRSFSPSLLLPSSALDTAISGESDDDSVCESFGPHGAVNHIDPVASPPSPICPALKPKKGRRRKNIFIDDRGFPDQSDEFDTILHNVDGGPILRCRKHPSRDLSDIDPAFDVKFDESAHGEYFRKHFTPSPWLTDDQNAQLSSLIKKYWGVFDETGLFIPVRDYECVIDTGSAKPIAVKNINYGPRETPILRKHISALLKLGHISQIDEGQWLFKALLAPKPHQEHVYDILDFKWRFCVNFIPLNAVTLVIAYPIPRCDAAVNIDFGRSVVFWVMDAPQGYHQLRAAAGTRLKLAFAGPDAIKYAYNVMPFGPVNGPYIFIQFMHDMDSRWKEIAEAAGITIDEDTNSRLIVDDIFSHAPTFDAFLGYLECQLQVCLAQNLSLKLEKCIWCPKRVEFVGVDVGIDGNRPAQSKHQLLESWPKPTLVRDVASFVGFALFYSTFIPMFEVRVQRLREIMKHEYTDSLEPHWDSSAQAEWDDISRAILNDPCLQRFDHRKRLYVLTDFCKDGFGWCACQPGNDAASLDAMTREMAGDDCEFLLPKSSLVLHPIALGCRRTRGNETRLHSYLGEAFAGDYAINKLRHYCWGMQFTWLTDCYALRFVMSYDGNNPAVLRLQMRLMCWDMVIVHRPGTEMTAADYLSRLGADLCFDPLLKDYIERVSQFKLSNRPISTLPMLPANMPGYRGPRKRSTPASDSPDVEECISDNATVALIDAIYVRDSNGHGSYLANVPVCFGSFHEFIDLTSIYKSKPLYNSELVLTARAINECHWAIYSFNCGHFASSIETASLPFRITLAADPFQEGRDLFREFTDCPTVLEGARELYDHIRASGDRSPLDGYLLHSQRFDSSGNTRAFWQLQASIINELHSLPGLSLFVAVVHPDHDARAVTRFQTALSQLGWILSSTQAYYPDFGDSVADSTQFVIGVHSLSDSVVEPLQVPVPPPSCPAPIGAYVWVPFNSREYAISYAKDSPSFGSSLGNNDPDASLQLSDIKTGPSPSHLLYSSALYALHRQGSDPSIQCGATVQCLNHLCPPFISAKTNNIFQHHFGIEFQTTDDTFVRPISPFEFVKCFQLTDKLTYRLSHPRHLYNMDNAVPAKTSSFVLQLCHDRLISIRNANIQIYNPDHQYTAPAAMCNVFVNGAIGSRLPDTSAWKQAYEADPETRLIMDMIANPSLITKTNLAQIHSSLRMPVRQQLLVIEQGMIIYQEPLGYGSTTYCKLRLVPSSLRNIVFIAFHANPIGGHLSHVRTHLAIRMRFYWPNMFKYCKEMCAKCPACALANKTSRRASELVYGFPVTAPFSVLHADGFHAGKIANFEGDEMYLIVCCGMTSFGVMESVHKPDAKGFAAALMRVLLRFGLCHTLVIDKASAFFGVFRQVVYLLNLNCHVISSENHDAMLCERLNRFLVKGLKVMSNERQSVRISAEAILLALYAWNSAPIPGTDLPRSLVVTRRVFQFPIDFSTSKHLELTSTPATVVSYAKDQATLLAASRAIASVLLEEHRSWHRELINSSRPDPTLFELGDVVFARRAMKSVASKGRVGKLMYPMTGPWKVIEKLDGSSYRLEHCLKPGRFEKKHASMMSPYPLELIPFQPVDGPDHRFSTINRPIAKSPFVDAGLNGYTPLQPYKLPANLAIHHNHDDFYWPSLSELNDDLGDYPWQPGEQDLARRLEDTIDTEPVLYSGPPPSPPSPSPPQIPPIASLTAAILRSTDRLFFIAFGFGDSATREWRLVRVALDDSISLHPACLQDGRFLVEFYVPHINDVRYNGINTRYWLQYHSMQDISSPLNTSNTHLIRPSETSERFALRRGLRPFRQWVNLTHESTFIHGPFEFASIHDGRQSRDRVSLDDWKVLAAHSSLYSNKPPKLDLPTYSVHIDRGILLTYVSAADCALLQASALSVQTNLDRLHC
eukprot:scaffold143282_cov76-Cyclotella_meneghiniana.AAC.4